METWIPYLLPLVLLPLSLYVIFFIRKRGSSHLKHLPPGSEGWPILGENVELSLLGSQQLVRDRMHKYSPRSFRTSLFGEKIAVLCGAQGNKFVFTNENTLFSRWPPLSLRKALYPDLNNTGHQAPVATFYAYQSEILKQEALQQYVAVMDSLAREHMLEWWNPNPVVKVLPLAKKYSFELACRVFMNVVDPERLEKLLVPFSLLTKGMVSLPINLPGTAFRGAVRGGQVVRDELLRIMKERREELKTAENRDREGRRDLLSKMLLATNEDMNDDKVANMILGLLVAGEYEVASAVTVVINYLAQLPHIYDQVFKEQMTIAKSKGPDEPLAWEDVEKMKYTWNVVRECFRLTPPSMGTFREARAEFTYAGFTIPKGWKILLTAHSSHMNPNYFPKPEKFDPSRFEESGPAPYTYIPFGGGTRMCPGRGYVKVVILVFVHNLVTRFRLEKVIPNEKMLFNRVSPAPAHDLPLHLHPHQK